jgi:hypothetical protein
LIEFESIEDLALALHEVMCDWSAHPFGTPLDAIDRGLHLTRYRSIARSVTVRRPVGKHLTPPDGERR